MKKWGVLALLAASAAVLGGCSVLCWPDGARQAQGVQRLYGLDLMALGSQPPPRK